MTARDEALADRLVSYADAAAAVAFVGVSGFGIAIADPDAQRTISEARVIVLAANVFLGVLLTAMLLILRRWELDLREGSALSPKAARYARRLHAARLVVVWASVLLVGLLAIGVDVPGGGG